MSTFKIVIKKCQPTETVFHVSLRRLPACILRVKFNCDMENGAVIDTPSCGPVREQKKEDVRRKKEAFVKLHQSHCYMELQRHIRVLG